MSNDTGTDNNTSPDAIVSIKDMTFRRGQKVIFDGVSMDFERGKVTAVMGPSGTGKTTLLRLIGGQIKPQSGSITMDGQEIPSLGHRKLLELRKRMSLLFQQGALLTDLSAFDNVAFPLREHTELTESLIEKLVLMKLEAVGLRGAAQLYPSELSGGMARRVALARAIALDPCLVMYDEPFTGQDPISMGVLVRLIEELNDAMNLTSIVVTHDVTEVLDIADYAYVLSGGKVIGGGTPKELRNSDNERLRQFIDGLPDGPVQFHQPAAPLREQLLGAA